MSQKQKSNIIVTEEATESLKKLRDSGLSDNEIGLIYGHYDKINNKWYCGETTSLNPEYRWGTRGSQYLKQDTKFAQAIKSIGWDNFDHYILQYCKKSLLYEVEKIFIEQKDSFRNGYNSNAGYGAEVSLETGRKISEKLKGHPVAEKARQNIENYNRTVVNRPKLIGTDNHMATKVRMIDFISKKEIKVFDTIREAAEYAGLKSQTNISKCCRHPEYSTKCNGYNGRVSWEVVSGNIRVVKPLSEDHKANISKAKRESTNKLINNKPVIMFSTDGIELKRFQSLREASIFVCGKRTLTNHISQCCSGDRKTSGKYNGQPVTWRFADNGNKEREV